MELFYRKFSKERNNILQSAAKNLNIPGYEEHDSLSQNIDHLNLNAIIKWKNHSSILALVSEHRT